MPIVVLVIQKIHTRCNHMWKTTVMLLIFQLRVKWFKKILLGMQETTVCAVTHCMYIQIN